MLLMGKFIRPLFVAGPSVEVTAYDTFLAIVTQIGRSIGLVEGSDVLTSMFQHT